MRRRQQLTLRELATKLGTTPQTVQRLETGRMTVSVEWLHRFADIFEVEPAHLISSSESAEPAFLGHVDASGIVQLQRKKNKLPPLLPPIVLNDPVVAKTSAAIGMYAAHTYIIADRQPLTSATTAENKVNSLACIKRDKHNSANQLVKLGHVVRTRNDKRLFVSFGEQADCHWLSECEWLAPIQLSIREF